MDPIAEQLRPLWTMHWLEAPTRVPRPQALGRTEDEVLEEIGDASEAWVKKTILR